MIQFAPTAPVSRSLNLALLLVVSCFVFQHHVLLILTAFVKQAAVPLYADFPLHIVAPQEMKLARPLKKTLVMTPHSVGSQSRCE